MSGKSTYKSFHERFSIKEELGRGAFAFVFRCVNIETKKEYAAKVFEKEKLSQRDILKIKREILICGKLDHPHIVRLLEAISDEKYRYLIFDLVTGGELLEDLVETSKGLYTEEVTAKCMFQLLEAVAYCHSMGVVHRDLKPENILLESKANKIIKLADFGLAVQMEKNQLKRLGIAGTRHYLAPEVLEMKPFGRPVDCWACGVIMYILISGFMPFHHHNERRMTAKIIDGDYDMHHETWDTVSEEGKDLVQKLLCVVPNRRLTADQALKHTWFTKMNTSKEECLVRTDTIERLRQFNAKRKLKATVHSQRFVASLLSWKKAVKIEKQVPSLIPLKSSSSVESESVSRSKTKPNIK